MSKINLKPSIEITYCTQCRWLMRAGWLAQELLTTFENELKAVNFEKYLKSGSGFSFRKKHF